MTVKERRGVAEQKLFAGHAVRRLRRQLLLTQAAMAEALGVSQIYMGFVLTAVRQDRKAKLAAMLGLGDRRICAVMALGMPQFRYPNYIDRAPAPVTRK